MTQILLTQYSGRFLGPVAKLLGYLMNGIYIAWDSLFHVQNIAVCIITMTVIIYLCMLPLTFKQQKFSRLNREMQPEIKKIQAKYKNRRDQASQMAMQEETKAIYDKYGVSPMGSCLQMVIQIPILWALYRVMYNVPAYVPKIKATFDDIVNGIMNTDGYKDIIQNIYDTFKPRNVNLDFTDATTTADSIIDVVYRLTSDGWSTLKDSFPNITDVIDTTRESISNYNYIFGINISESPLYVIRTSFSSGEYLLVLLGILIPILSAITQLLNIRLTQNNMMSADAAGDAMANQMKTMNYIMPVFSFIMVFSLPVGIGVYWIVGALVRTGLQLIINKHLDKMDMDTIIAKNEAKAKAKAEKRKEKMGIYENQIRQSASLKTKNIDTSKISSNAKVNSGKYKAGSMAAKANLVQDMKNKNNKK